MSKIRHSVEVKGRGHTWSVPTYITEQTAQDWRDDGLTVHAIENTIPYWLPSWCADMTTLLEARAAANEGMQIATAHADEDIPGWSDMALEYIHSYALSHERFTGWHVTHTATLTNAVPQKSGKAWGALFQKAQRLKWIEKCGYAQDPNRNLNPCSVYRSLVYREAA